MTRKIPSINYIILIGIIILVISACFAFNNLYNVYQNNKISVSPLSDKEVLYNDLKNTTKEIDADTLLVISYVHNTNVYNNEVEIKKLLFKYNLFDNITYLNITDYMIEDGFLNNLNKTLKLENTLTIKKFPAVVYYKDGTPTYSIDSTDHLLDAGDFKKIVDIYELANLERK